MTAWVQSVCKIGVFIICAQILVHCRPDSSYEKYLKMLVSAMILVQMLAPVCSLLFGAEAESMEQKIQWFQEVIQESGTDGTAAWMRGTPSTEDAGEDDKERMEQIERVEIKPVRLGGAQNEED